MTQILRRISIQPILLVLASLVITSTLLSLSCAGFSETRGYSATGSSSINRNLPAQDERRDAITRAENEARDQIMRQTAQLRLNDGRSIVDLAVVDPFIRAALMDAVRNAHLVNRNVSSDGHVVVTLSMDIEPLQRLIENYHPQANGKK